MAVISRCRFCNQKLKIPSARYGVPFPCPGCSQVITVDAAAAAPKEPAATDWPGNSAGIDRKPRRSDLPADQANEPRVPATASGGAGIQSGQTATDSANSLGPRLFSLKRVPNRQGKTSRILRGMWISVGGGLAATYALAILLGLFGLAPDIRLLLFLPLPLIPVVGLLHWHYHSNVEPRICFDVHQNGLYLYHPVTLLHRLRGGVTIHFENIRKVTNPDKSGFTSLMLPVYRIIRRRLANLIENDSPRHLVILQKKGGRIALYQWADHYTEQSCRNLVNTLKRHRIEVTLDGYTV